MTVEFRLNNCVIGFHEVTCGFLSSINEVLLTRRVTQRIPLKHTTPLTSLVLAWYWHVIIMVLEWYKHVISMALSWC